MYHKPSIQLFSNRVKGNLSREKIFLRINVKTHLVSWHENFFRKRSFCLTTLQICLYYSQVIVVQLLKESFWNLHMKSFRAAR